MGVFHEVYKRGCPDCRGVGYTQSKFVEGCETINLDNPERLASLFNARELCLLREDLVGEYFRCMSDGCERTWVPYPDKRNEDLARKLFLEEESPEVSNHDPFYNDYAG